MAFDARICGPKIMTEQWRVYSKIRLSTVSTEINPVFTNDRVRIKPATVNANKCFRQNLINNPVNPLPDDKILDWSKLKQIADDILALYSIDTRLDTSTTNSF